MKNPKIEKSAVFKKNIPFDVNLNRKVLSDILTFLKNSLLKQSIIPVSVCKLAFPFHIFN
jgi:hypothetical protein